MYTDKKNILLLAALLQAHGVRKAVLCPGSRNIPIVKTLASMPGFTCYPAADERGAGYFALGLALHGGSPVAVCCTSGTALLNLHPAVAEAFYQQVPLVILSADRPAAWLGQMDGQAVPQPGVFGPLVKMSANLPEIRTEEDEWHCNRLVNEALLETCHHGKGPVHINIPVSEPLFQFTAAALPEARAIARYQGLSMYGKDYQPLISRLNQCQRRMAVVGQMNLIYLFNKRDSKLLYKHFAWFTEHTANQTVPGMPVRAIDPLLASMDDEAQERMKPGLLVTYGGHVISGRLKQFLRKHPPAEHWHISPDGRIADTYGRLTAVIEMDPFEFLERIAPLIDAPTPEYPRQWEALAKALPAPAFPYSQMKAIGEVLKRLPAPCALHLGNGSTVRYAQLFPLPPGVEVLSNRGTNGIDGSLSTAIGYAAASDKLNFVCIGDLSFFYGMNALWPAANCGANLRILLLNNGGGEIFHALRGIDETGAAARYITGAHHATAQSWAEACGFEYLPVHVGRGLEEAIGRFTQPSITRQPLLMEVFTDSDADVRHLREYYRSLKKG